MTNEIEDRDKKNKNDIRIVGFNLLALAIYTLVMKTTGDDGYILDAIIIALHFFACLILSLVNRSWMWLLSAIMVLILGFSTCAYIPVFR